LSYTASFPANIELESTFLHRITAEAWLAKARPQHIFDDIAPLFWGGADTVAFHRPVLFLISQKLPAILGLANELLFMQQPDSPFNLRQAASGIYSIEE
jgi:hypothetical protein